jgi:hypothetical protein
MANLIQATVYQIDGSPLPAAATLDFQTSNLVIREATVPTIAAVQSAISYYNVPNNSLSVQTFFVSETIATLVADANNAGTTQTQVTVLTINEDPQVPGGVQYSFPSNEILVGEFTDASIGVQAYVQFKNVKYYTQENEAAILAASNNTGVAAGTNPTSLFIPYNNGGIFGDSYFENDTLNSTLKSVYSANDVGLKLDFAANTFSFGDLDYINNGAYILIDDQNRFIEINGGGNSNNTALFVEDITSKIRTSYTNTDYGIELDFANRNFTLGDYAGNFNETRFIVDDTNTIVKTTFQNNDIGLQLDFANNVYKFGDYTNVGGSASNLLILGSEVAVETVLYGISGFKADGTLASAWLGDFNGNANNTFLILDDVLQRLELSGNLEASTAGASSGKFLKITIGGVDYKIALLNN